MKKPTKKELDAEIDQAEKELMLNPSIDIEVKKNIIKFREWCKEFPAKFNKLSTELKRKRKMKKLIIILMFVPLLCNAQFEFVNKIPMDKQKHAFVGAGISAATICADKYLFEREMNPIAPTVIAGSIAFFWEVGNIVVNDNKRFSGKDLIWTTASAAAINLILRQILKPQNKNKKKAIPEEDPFDEFPLVRKQ